MESILALKILVKFSNNMGRPEAKPAISKYSA